MVELKGGLLVSEEAFALAFRLEQAGHRLSVSNGLLVVSEGAKLSADDKAAIRKHRLHLLAIAGYTTEAP